jgi:chromosome segregation ATPase
LKSLSARYEREERRWRSGYTEAKSRADELQSERTNLKRTLATLDIDRAEWNAELSELRARAEGAGQAASSIKAERAGLLERLDSARANIEVLREVERQSVSAEDMARLKDEITHLAKSLSAAQDEMAALEAARAAAVQSADGADATTRVTPMAMTASRRRSTVSTRRWLWPTETWRRRTRTPLPARR